MQWRKASALITATVLAAVVGLAAPAQAASGRWYIEVYTACQDGAGTDGDIYVQFLGDYGSSSSYYLDNPNSDDFEECAVNRFTKVGLDLGVVREIHLNFLATHDYAPWLPEGIWLEFKNSSGQITDSAWFPNVFGWLSYSAVFRFPREY